MATRLNAEGRPSVPPPSSWGARRGSPHRPCIRIGARPSRERRRARPH